MTNTNEILEMLRAGKSIQEIGDNFANILNAAKTQYDQEETKKKAETIKLNKLTRIIADFINWIDEYVTPVPDDEDPEALAKEFIKTLDATKSITESVADKLFADIDFDTLEKCFGNTNKPQKKEESAARAKAEADLQSLVDMFLGQ